MKELTAKELVAKISMEVEDEDMPVVVRGENVVSGISDVYIDFDHTDDSKFISIDLLNED